MGKQVQHRRGTTAQHATFTGAVGEITVDTDLKTAVVHDGATAGGFPLNFRSVTNITALRALTPAAGLSVHLRGYASSGDGGGGEFYAVTTGGPYTDNGGTIITQSGGTASSAWLRIVNSPLNLKWFGAKGDGTTDNTAALNAALNVAKSFSVGGSPVTTTRYFGEVFIPPGKYRFNSSITFDFPNPAIGSQATWAISGITISGAGADVTTLYWPSGNGFIFNMSSQQHSIHMRALSITTDGAGAGNAITLTNSYAFFGTFVAQSDFTDVTFRGDDGYGNTKYWTKCIVCANVSDINFNNVNFYATSNATVGTGIEFSQPGAGCFASGSSNTCGTVYNFVNCNWSFLGTGVVVGAHTQTVQIVNSFFGQCTTAVSVPFVASNTLQGLTVSGSTFFIIGDIIVVNSDLPNLIVTNNLFVLNDAKTGIFIATNNNTTITGNQFIPYDAPNTQAAGIDIAATIAGSIAIIDGNTFSSVNQGIVLEAGTSGIKVGPSNHFTNLSSNVINLGTGNFAGLSYDQNGFRVADPTGGLGYFTGAGGSVTQATSKATSVTLNKVCGRITTNNANLVTGTEVSFTVNNTNVSSTDVIYAVASSGNYIVRTADMGSGTFKVYLKNNSGGDLAEAVLINFIVLKSVIS